MGSKHLQPDIQLQAAAMLAAGWTQTAIADRLNISASSVRRVQERYKVKKGAIKADIIDQARTDLINSSEGERLKFEASALLVDELAQVRRLREIMALGLEGIEDDPSKVALIMRASAAHSTALKNTSDVIRKMLPVDESLGNDLPVLTIRELTDDMAKQIMKNKEANEQELGAVNLTAEVDKIETIRG